eukprot:TRINITY_DN27564_c0_g1_i1.p1 TRINITY_DN27564_c0_g1~~TRINITY_DN27564_c0_g1_i1.p1  ORF type:complete len:256 (+),score=16.94 TRINITY_DN27564_c0_g1_i1:64-831(+)
MQSGRRHRRGLKVGSSAIVKHAKHHYPSYTTMAKQMKLVGYAENRKPTDGQVVKVVGLARHHDDQATRLVGVRDVVTGHEFVMKSIGVAPLNKSPQLPAAVMQHMWRSRTSTGDVRLVAKGDTIIAHSCVLVTVSPVFARALQTETQEAAATKEITLSDTPAAVVQGVLETIYLDSMPDDLDHLAALKFAHLNDIFAVCEPLVTKLFMNMTCDTAPRIIRMLRDYTSGGRTNYVDRFLQSYRGNDEIMRAVITNL